MTAEATPTDGAAPRRASVAASCCGPAASPRSLAAVLAACGDIGDKGEPGRVGFAPTPTDLAKREHRRRRAAAHGDVDRVHDHGRLRHDHQERCADSPTIRRSSTASSRTTRRRPTRLAELTTQFGAEPYECVNAWYMDRVVPPIFENINGDEAKDIPPSDDPARDMLATVNAWESMDGAMYQGMVETMASPELRSETMKIGAMAGRHAAVSAIHATGAPDGYFDPALIGGEEPAAEGRPAAAVRDPDRVRQPGADAARDRRRQLGRHPLHAADRHPRRQLVRLHRPELPGDLSPRRPAEPGRASSSRSALSSFGTEPRTLWGDGESAGWPRRARHVEESRDSTGQGAGESQVGAT